MMLTGYPAGGPGPAARRSGRPRGRRWRSWPRDLADAGLGELAVIVGYLDDDGGGPRNALAPSCTRRGRRDATTSTTCPTTACSTSAATSSRAPRSTVVRLPRRRHRADDLRGPLAGRRPVRGRRRGRRRPGGQHQRLAVRAATRTTCGCRCCGAGAAEAGAPIVVREHGRRPGRAGLRRRLDGGRRGRRAARPGAAVRRGRAPASTSTCPAAADAPPAAGRARR